MSKVILATIVVFILSSAISAHAQEPSPQFDRLSIEHGLSNSSVLSIHQDRQGFLWIGTLDGLNKYDGYQFTTYRHDPSNPNTVSDNAIWVIHQDQAGALWLGTNGGLNRFDPATETFVNYRYDPANKNSLSHDRIWAIHEDGLGVLWIGTDGGGLNRFDPVSETFTVYRHDANDPNSLNDNRVMAIAEDQHGILWVGTWDGGLNRFDPATETFTHFRHDPSRANSLSHNRVLAIHVDQQNIIWIGTWDSGLNRFDPVTESFTLFRHRPSDPTSLSNDDIRTIYEDRQGRLWIGTWDGGLNRFDPVTGIFASYRHNPDDSDSLSGNRIRAVLEDQGGVIWVGSWDGGLTKLHQSTKQFFSYRYSDRNGHRSLRDIRTVIEAESGMVWLGTADGLYRLDRRDEQIIPFSFDSESSEGFSHGQINTIFQDRAGTFWIGTNDGLSHFDVMDQTLTTYQPIPYTPSSLSHAEVNVTYQDRRGVLWVGTVGGGLNKFDASTQSFTHYQHSLYERDSLSNNVIRAIIQDQDGILWVGTSGGGLNRFDPLTQSFTRYQYDSNNPNSLSHDQVNVIYSDKRGTLWIGTKDGLNKFDPSTQSFRRFYEQDGLSSSVIRAIQEDDATPSNLWIATDEGLTRFNPTLNTSRNFGVDDGLPFSTFSRGVSFRNQEGELFFGGSEGLIVFHPDQVQNNPHQPPIVITRFQTNNKDFVLSKHIAYLDEINLSYQENVISFEFAALDYVAPEKNQYAYKLEGFDADWIKTDAQERLVTYTNLKPGQYIFRVQGSNNDGIWSEAGTAVKLIVHPPPWQTWWAYGLYIVGLGAIIFGVVQLRTRAQAQELARQREINELLETRVVARTRRLELVAALSERLNAILDVDQLLVELVNEVKDSLGYYHAQVFTLDAGRQNLILAASAGKVDDAVREQEVVTLPVSTPKSLLAQVARTGKIVIADNVFEAANWMPDPLRPHTKSEIGVPIIFEGNVVGVLDVQEDEFSALDDSDANLLTSLANQVGVAMENAHLYAAAQQELLEREKLITELDAFAYTVAHDFQNPLSIMIAYAELLGEEWSTPEDLKEASEVLTRNGHKLKSIVRELLLLAKMREQEVEPHPLDMAEIIDEAQQSLMLMIEARQAEITMPDSWPTALGYAPWVEEVWVNYLSNAIKYGGQPSCIKVGAEIQDDEMIRFWVRDNGNGLSAEEQTQLFLPFVQLSRGRVKGGYGLGLSIVQRIVEKLGGKVSVESSGVEGQGTTFSFTLPVAEASSESV